MPIRPLNDQTPNFRKLKAQLQEGEVLVGRVESDEPSGGTPNAGVTLTTQERFDAFVVKAKQTSFKFTFYGVPRGQAPRLSRSGGRSPRRK